jgi:hypothetical protein
VGLLLFAAVIYFKDVRLPERSFQGARVANSAAFKGFLDGRLDWNGAIFTCSNVHTLPSGQCPVSFWWYAFHFMFFGLGIGR